MLNIINSKKKDLIVFSYADWENLQPTSQQLFLKLSKGRRIFLVEQPDFLKIGKPAIKSIKLSRNLRILKPNSGALDYPEQFANLIKSQCQKWSFSDSPIFWFNSMYGENLKNYLNYSLTVYDEGNSMNYSVSTEKQKNFDIVLTRSLSKKNSIYKNIHYISDSVDRHNFEKVLDAHLCIPDDMKAIKPLVLGYHGIIDDSLDWSVIKKLCRALPQISVVMLGALSGITKSDIPAEKNLYYLGEKKYEDLPKYIKFFDIAWLPYKIKDNCINPTAKILEYMSARKRIIVSPLVNLENDFKEVVHTANNSGEVVDAIYKYLDETFAKKVNREFLQDKITKSTSWEKVAFEIDLLIQEILSEREVTEESDYRMEKFSFVEGVAKAVNYNSIQ